MNNTKQPLSGLLLLVVIVSVLTSGFVGYYVALNTTSQPKVGLLSSNLWLVTMNDTTKNRALDTGYRNLDTQGQARIVQVEINCVTTGNNCVVKVFVNQTAGYLNENAANESLKAEWFIDTSAVASKAINVTNTITFFVPWRFYYSVNSTGTVTPTIYLWIESIPPTGFGLIIAAVILRIEKD